MTCVMGGPPCPSMRTACWESKRCFKKTILRFYTLTGAGGQAPGVRSGFPRHLGESAQHAVQSSAEGVSFPLRALGQRQTI